MIEVFSILFQFIIFLIIFSFPFTPKVLNDELNIKRVNLNLIDAHSLNLIFFIYVCLIISFLNINLEVFFRIYFLISLIFIVFNLKKINLNFNKIDILHFLVFFLLIISIFFSIAQNLKLEWDGHHWIEKVLIFYNDNEIEALKNVTVHSYYPHLGSYIWAFFWKNSFLELEYFGRYFYVYFYIVAIFLFFNSFNLKNKIIKLFILLFFILITYEPYLFAGYQEFLIFSSLIFASRYISLIDFKKINLKLTSLILLILYTTCWFKDEGIIYFLIFSSILVVFLNISNLSKISFIFCIIGLLIFQYLLQKYLIGIYDFPQKVSISDIFYDLTNFKILFTKLFKILMHCLIAFIKYPLWLIICICVLIQLFFTNRIDVHSKYFLVCLFLNLAFIISIFFTFKNFDFMLKVSLDRLLFQTSGFYLALIFLSFKNIKLIDK